MKYLQHVTTKGVTINNIVFVKPSLTTWPDAFEYGIGEYSNNGLAWLWIIPASWHGKLTLNLLELLASSVTIYMTILKMVQGSHILAFIDSSSALVWMYKASFDPENEESHDAVARWLGQKIVSNETSLYSKQIKVTENIIADSLSRDFYRSYQTLQKHFNQIIPQQTEELLHIKKPTRNVISWI